MFKRILPFVVVAIVLGAVLSLLVATQRMGCSRPALGRFMMRAGDLPVDAPVDVPVDVPVPAEPDAGA
ncbi:MAG TPA: hypothetical protein VF971_06945 [Candidatus Limnocylindrales bacterium]